MTVRVCHPVPSLFGDWESLVNPSGLGPEDRRFESYISDHSFIDRNAHRCAAGLLIRVRLVRSQLGQPFCWSIV